MAELLDDFIDVIPAELPKMLAPRRPTDHKIELVPSVVPPAQVPYQISLVELAELWIWLDFLLDVGLIQPSKAPYGAITLL